MTAERVKAAQAIRPPKGARLLRGTVSSLSPLQVQLAGGTAVTGIAVPGATYTVGDGVLVLCQEPGVGPVFPTLTSYAPPAAAPATTGGFTYSGTGADWGAPRTTSVTRQGALGLLNLQMSIGTTPPSSGAVLLTLSAGFRPVRTVDLDVVLFNGGWNNQRATLDVGTDGRVLLNSSTVALAAGHGLFGSIPLPLV